MRWFIHDHKIAPLGRILDTLFLLPLSPDITSFVIYSYQRQSDVAGDVRLKSYTHLSFFLFVLRAMPLTHLFVIDVTVIDAE